MSLSKKARGVLTEKVLKADYGWQIVVSPQGDGGFLLTPMPPRGENPFPAMRVLPSNGEPVNAAQVQEAVNELRSKLRARKPDSQTAAEILEGLK